MAADPARQAVSRVSPFVLRNPYVAVIARAMLTRARKTRKMRAVAEDIVQTSISGECDVCKSTLALSCRPTVPLDEHVYSYSDIAVGEPPRFVRGKAVAAAARKQSGLTQDEREKWHQYCVAHVECATRCADCAELGNTAEVNLSPKSRDVLALLLNGARAALNDRRRAALSYRSESESSSSGSQPQSFSRPRSVLTSRGSLRSFAAASPWPYTVSSDSYDSDDVPQSRRLRSRRRKITADPLISSDSSDAEGYGTESSSARPAISFDST